MADDFGLMDFDSPGVSPSPFTVVVSLSGAVDGEREGLVLDTSGSDVEVVTSAQPEEFAVTYTLQGSMNYTEYQMVSIVQPILVLLLCTYTTLTFSLP